MVDVFVGNLSGDLNGLEDEIRQVFRTVGPVLSVRFMRARLHCPH